MPSEIYTKPRFFFQFSTPIVRNQHLKRRPAFVSRCTLGYFGCSSAKNTTWTLFLFAWAVCEWKRHEWHDRSDRERADEYLAKWSECEKELRGLRLLQMGDEIQDPELRKLLKRGFGINLDEGTTE